MPSVLYYEGSKTPSTFICTPSYGDLSAAYTHSLFRSQELLKDKGISCSYEILSGDCHVDDSRNRLVRDFLETDCEQLVFIDSDLRWEPKDLLKLIQYDYEVVAGIYPLKQDGDNYPVRHIGNEIWGNKDGLVPVESVPTGFLKIKRNVLEELSAKAHKFPSKSDSEDRMKISLIFERTFVGNTRWGGDYTFCNKWRELGGRIFIDPDMDFMHMGEKEWKGNYSVSLKKGEDFAIIDSIDKIKKGDYSVENLSQLINGWDNPWGASHELLTICIELLKDFKGEILELGSGLTTLIAAAVNPNINITALEHSPIWYEKLKKIIKKCGLRNVNLKYCQLQFNGENYEYNFYLKKYDFILCDGPPRAIEGGRECLINILNDNPDAQVLIDDYDKEEAFIKKVEEKTNFDFITIGQQRPYSIGRIKNGISQKMVV